ncbi:hypothetical protein J2S48_003927 [Promicromonospora iranensis]|uniref:ROS/MUCR transcriptional regulator protein n=1 Tax=Promicromonospora iranensis TaxID=1105144 RepID=A0ABU2CSU4_9MICO|nr:hypothetical protein [Promicromonospora iranensis]
MSPERASSATPDIAQISGILGVRKTELLAAMEGVDICEPLSVRSASAWARDPGSAPTWVRGAQAVAAERHSRKRRGTLHASNEPFRTALVAKELTVEAARLPAPPRSVLTPEQRRLAALGVHAPGLSLALQPPVQVVSTRNWDRDGEPRENPAVLRSRPIAGASTAADPRGQTARRKSRPTMHQSGARRRCPDCRRKIGVVDYPQRIADHHVKGTGRGCAGSGVLVTDLPAEPAPTPYVPWSARNQLARSDLYQAEVRALVHTGDVTDAARDDAPDASQVSVNSVPGGLPTLGRRR